MKKLIVSKLVIVVSLLSLLNLTSSFAYGKNLPEFTQTDASQWINSKPLTVSDLRGSVVLLDVWTFECWNCYRSFPWLNDIEKRFSAEGLKIIGIHTPEFARERVISNIKEKVKEFKLHHAVMVDNDMRYWRLLDNRYWPAFYIIDKKGKIRDLYVGEIHIGDRNAKRIAAKVQELLQE